MKIALLGDMALIGRYDRTLHDDVDKKIDAIRKILAGADYAIANLEAPFTDASFTTKCKGVYLKTDPANVETLKSLGITHVTLANNHIHDYGNRGAKQTVETLQKAGIEYVGLGSHPKLIEKENDRVLFDGFCCLTANAVKYGTDDKAVQELTVEGLKAFLSQAKEKNALPIASVHYGIEGLHYPSTEHLRLFRHFTKDHDYVLHGNHPHAMQGMEEKDGSLLIYSQGNLFFDEVTKTSIHTIPPETDEERKSIIVLLDISGTKVTGYEVYAVTDLETYYPYESDAVKAEFEQYCAALHKSESELDALRERELKAQSANAPAHDFKFYRDRLNYQYLGAYLNGRRHAKKYQELKTTIDRECNND